MEIRLTFMDGTSITVDETGDKVEYFSRDGVSEGTSESNGFPTVNGLWYSDVEYTIPWEEIVAQLRTENFTLGNVHYLDNGYVLDENLVANIDVTDGPVTISYYPDAGGCDTSGWNNTDDNVYCEDCDTRYKVSVDLDDYKPHWCSFCGSTNLILREDVKEGK